MISIEEIYSLILKWNEENKGNREVLLIAAESVDDGVETCAMIPTSENFGDIFASLLHPEINEPQAKVLRKFLTNVLYKITEDIDDLTFASVFPVDLQATILVRTKEVLANIGGNGSR